MLSENTTNTTFRAVLNSDETARYVGLSHSTLRKLRLSGSGGPVYLKLGRRVVYSIKDLDAWLESKRCKSTSEYAAA